MSGAQVAVIGGGISGCLTACLLADVGVSVLIIEQGDALINGASRWNDGKIHLGYTFTGTPSLATAALMQEGAAVFRPTIERVLGARIPDPAFGEPVMYLVDRGSMIEPDVLWRRAQAVAGRLRASMACMPGLSAYSSLGHGASRQGPSDSLLEYVDPEGAMAETGQGGVVAAWRTTELHLATRRVADDLVAAVRARAIPVMHARVTGVIAEGRGWRVMAAEGRSARATVVVNSSWESRVLIDRSVQRTSDPPSIRYKVALFGQGAPALRALTPSTRILGRYGDVATYSNGDACLSWYPAGLLARSDDGVPPLADMLDVSDVTTRTLQGLGLSSAVLKEPGSRWQIAGGYIVAHGHGDIDDPDSPLHERYRPDVTELRPGYLSVDTGKYTLGPLMALRASRMAVRRLGLRRLTTR